MTRLIRWYDYITFNVYFLGLTTLSQTMGLITPLLVQQFVGESQKATYYGTFRLFTLMVALLAQALMGMFSDRSTISWGRRRPYILIGTLATAVLTILIGFTAGMEGMVGFWVLFAIGLVQPVASNMSQAAEQGIIPDLVPDEQRGRFSGVKALLEIPLPLILVAFTVGRMVSKGNMWAGLLLAVGVLLVTMLITMLVPEKPIKADASSHGLETIGTFVGNDRGIHLHHPGFRAGGQACQWLIEGYHLTYYIIHCHGFVWLGGYADRCRLGGMAQCAYQPG